MNHESVWISTLFCDLAGRKLLPFRHTEITPGTLSEIILVLCSSFHYNPHRIVAVFDESGALILFLICLEYRCLSVQKKSNEHQMRA